MPVEGLQRVYRRPLMLCVLSHSIVKSMDAALQYVPSALNKLAQCLKVNSETPAAGIESIFFGLLDLWLHIWKLQFNIDYTGERN